jgi:hypothetical protein
MIDTGKPITEPAAVLVSEWQSMITATKPTKELES